MNAEMARLNAIDANDATRQAVHFSTELPPVSKSHQRLAIALLLSAAAILILGPYFYFEYVAVSVIDQRLPILGDLLDSTAPEALIQIWTVGEISAKRFLLTICALAGTLLVVLAAVLWVSARKRQLLSEQDRALAWYPRIEKFTYFTIDSLILICSFTALSWPLYDFDTQGVRLSDAILIGQSSVVLITIGWFWFLLEHYARRRPFWDELREIFKVLIAMFMVLASFFYISGVVSGQTTQIVIWGLTFLLIPLGRVCARWLLSVFGLWLRPAVFIGTGKNAQDAYLAVTGEANLGYNVLGFVRTLPETPEFISVRGRSIPVLHSPAGIPKLLEQLKNPQAIIALDSMMSERSQLLVQELVSRYRNVHIVPAIRGLPLYGMQISNLFSHEALFLTVRHNLSRRSYNWVKRAFDLVVASVLLVVLAPVFLAIAYLVRRDGGKVLYGQHRIGRNGVPFRCLKFRSMRPDAEVVLQEILKIDPLAKAEWERDYKLKNDPRITRIGGFLRETSLDELPQLINVLRGEMSLVGPRPIIAAELERYGGYSDLYLQTLPGMTGLWQVSGRNDTSYAERVALDSWYVQNWSLWYDIAIMLRTIRVVLGKRGAY